jgi:hypothetical protein
MPVDGLFLGFLGPATYTPSSTPSSAWSFGERGQVGVGMLFMALADGFVGFLAVCNDSFSNQNVFINPVDRGCKQPANTSESHPRLSHGVQRPVFGQSSDAQAIYLRLLSMIVLLPLYNKSARKENLQFASMFVAGHGTQDFTSTAAANYLSARYVCYLRLIRRQQRFPHPP